MNRPSPPFAPSSLGDRRSLASAEGEDTSPRLPPRKRYSSSFGHRYATSGGGTSDGSPGSTVGVERKDGERSARSGTGSGSSAPAFLGATTDDDDISIFVQEIDARKPLASVAARQPFSASPDAMSSRLPILPSSPGTLGRRGIPEPVVSAASRPGSASASGYPGADAALGLGLVAGEHSRHSSERMSASDGESKRSSTSMGPMLTREAEVDEKLRHMHDVFLASLEGLGSGSIRRRNSASGGPGSGSATGVARGEDSAPISRPSSRGAGGLGVGLPSGLGRERHSGSPRSVSVMVAGSSGRQTGSSGMADIEGDSPQRLYSE